MNSNTGFVKQEYKNCNEAGGHNDVVRVSEKQNSNEGGWGFQAEGRARDTVTKKLNIIFQLE